MNSFSDDLLTALAPVVQALEQLGVFYYVAGSAASSNYYVARSMWISSPIWQGPTWLPSWNCSRTITTSTRR